MERPSSFGRVSHYGQSSSRNKSSHSNVLALPQVHCSAVDAWWVQLNSISVWYLTLIRTLRFMFDDLQIACSDLSAYCKLLPRPPYGKYARWLDTCDYEAGLTFWLTRHTTFDHLVLRFPVLGLGDTPSASTMNAKKLLHLPKMRDKEFSLPIMGRTCFSQSITPILYQIYVWIHLWLAKVSLPLRLIL